MFMPFKVQEVQDKGGIYFGENAISHNLIMCNKANLLNQSAFLLGVPGSGKSFSAKELIAFLILNTTDDVLICDPENEFGALAAALGKETTTVIHMAAGGKDRLNAMYMVDGYGENNPIVEKSQFIMSLVEQIDKAGVSGCRADGQARYALRPAKQAAGTARRKGKGDRLVAGAVHHRLTGYFRSRKHR